DLTEGDVDIQDAVDLESYRKP
ncbi:hypothetical protein Tco_1196192, partial [Tanacetum coccineum]